MTYSKFATELLEPFGGKKLNNLNDVLRIKDKNIDLGDTFIPADYHEIESFINKLKVKGNTFSSITLNVESIKSKFSKILAFLQTVSDSGCYLDCLLLQETWLTDKQCEGDLLDLYKIPGYHIIPLGRKCGRKGGLIIYLNEKYKYEARKNLYKTSTDWEGLFIDVTHENGEKLMNKITIANIYRPPRENYSDASIDKFLKPMKDIILKLVKENSTIISGGDYNINLLDLNREKFQEYFDIFVSNGLFPQITLPTRFSKKKATLIDQIYCRYSKYTSNNKSGIIMTKISDHLPCFSIMNLNTKTIIKPKFVKVTKITPSNITNFQSEVDKKILLTDFDRNPLTDPNENYNKLEKIIKHARIKCFPETTVRFNKYKHKICPWITYGILNSTRTRDRLYVKWKKLNPLSDKYKVLEKQFQEHVEILDKLIREAKIHFYKNDFDKVKSDIKKTWGKINEILNRSRKEGELPNYFFDGEKTITDNGDIANLFNNFFCGIGPKLAQSIKGPAGKCYKDNLKQTFESRFTFNTVDSDYIYNQIKQLKTKTSFGHDGLSSKLLKYIDTKVADILACIINQSLLTGIFPDSLKLAKVAPVFKKDDPHLTDNYRPISLLPVISKVFEKVVFRQVYDYFNDNNLLYKNQYGFRKKHSTELAGLEFHDKIVSELEKSKLPLAIFLDLSKAFDTIDHEIMLTKLQYYGITGISLQWFRSYLTGRRQYVQFKDSISSQSPLTTGVPQGSILGPLMFIIYMNDIAHVTDKFHFTIYADDTTLIAPICSFAINSNKDYKEISININKELEIITDWLALNKLSLNAKKTKMMLFHFPQKKITNINLDLKINRTKIEQVDEFCFLGVMFDECITWKSHVKKIASKISVAVGTINKLKRFLPQNILKMIYNALALPHINYGLLLWGQNSGRIFKLQKWAVRAITCSKYNAHSEPLFSKLKLLKIEDIHKIALLKFFHRYTNNSLPKYFDNFFEQKFPDHDHDTRHKNKPMPPDLKKASTKNCLRFYLPTVMENMHPHLLKDIKSMKLPGFSKNAKSFFLKTYTFVCSDPQCWPCQDHEAVASLAVLPFYKYKNIPL